MTHIAQTRLSIDTAPREIKEITAEVAQWTERQRLSVGLLTVYIPHTSASLLIQENASPDVRRDLDAFLRRLVPEELTVQEYGGSSWIGPEVSPHFSGSDTERKRRISARKSCFARIAS